MNLWIFISKRQFFRIRILIFFLYYRRLRCKSLIFITHKKKEKRRKRHSPIVLFDHQDRIPFLIDLFMPISPSVSPYCLIKITFCTNHLLGPFTNSIEICAIRLKLRYSYCMYLLPIFFYCIPNV